MMLFLLMIAGMWGCCDNNDDEEIQSKDQITFDNVEILCNVLPPGHYSEVRFTSQNTAYTITNNGKIFKTEDGGNTWVQQNSGTERHLYDMFFLNDLHGYVVGNDGVTNEGIILKTVDGGNTWESANFQIRLSAIHFINESIGFATGRKLFKTQDGGTTWDEIDLGYYSYGDISFFDENTGFMNAIISTTFQPALLKTTDGGVNWIVLNNINVIGEIQILNGLAFLHSYSKIFKTCNKGESWIVIDDVSGTSVRFLNEHQGVGVGQFWHELGYFPNGMLYITNDGGKHWEKKYFPADEFYSIEDIDFSNDSTALAVGHTSGCVVKLRF